jgi:hypothetical protein
VIWRLGKDGDFLFDSTDPYPWFSHQHDGNIETSDPCKLTVFDNGNTRVGQGQGNSRGQELQLFEAQRVARLTLNSDLGVYSMAVGSAQKLPDGNYHFDCGFVWDDEEQAMHSYSMEVDSTGKIIYDLEADTVLYRSFRLNDMYSSD